jgi:hypothetical protein
MGVTLMDQQNSPTANSAGLMDKVRQGATTQLSTQKDRATDGIGTVAHAVRQTTQQLRDQQHETIAYYVEEAANQLEQFSNRLRDKDVAELMREAQQFAKRRPAVFIGSAFAVGLLGARFFKSSREREYRGYGRNSHLAPPTNYRTNTGFQSPSTTASPAMGGSERF